MEFIKENIIWFGAGGAILLMTLIGYYAEKTDFGRNKDSDDTEKTPKKEKKKKDKKKKKGKEDEEADLNLPADNINKEDNFVEEIVPGLDAPLVEEINPVTNNELVDEIVPGLDAPLEIENNQLEEVVAPVIDELPSLDEAPLSSETIDTPLEAVRSNTDVSPAEVE